MAKTQIGISSFILASPFGDEDLAVLPGVREMGYDLVEICVEDPTRLSAPRVKDAAQDVGLGLSIGGAFGPTRDVSHESPAERQVGVEYLCACIQFAADVNAAVVSGPMYSAAGKARMLSPDERVTQRRWAVEGLRVAADFAAARNVSLAIEPLNRFETDLVNTVEQGVELCALIGRPNVGLTLDTFHLNIEEKSIGDAIREAGPLIRSFQASENDRGAPGSGHIPWQEAFHALHGIGYQGPIIVESFRPDATDIAGAVSLWRPVAASMDGLARESIAFIRQAYRQPDTARL